MTTVLLDWGGTLCHPGDVIELIDAAAARVGATVDAHAVLAALEANGNQHPDRDTSIEAGRTANLEELAAVGIAGPLADAICDLEAAPDHYAPYPDTRAFLEALGDRRVVIVSNCAVDVRECFRFHGLDDLIDDYVLSCEHGVAKPDRRLFEVALGGTPPHEALMVGDSMPDAGAIAIGIPTILLPPARGVDHPRGFDVVLKAIA